MFAGILRDKTMEDKLMYITPSVDYNLWPKTLNTNGLEPANLNLII